MLHDVPQRRKDSHVCGIDLESRYLAKLAICRSAGVGLFSTAISRSSSSIEEAAHNIRTRDIAIDLLRAVDCSNVPEQMLCLQAARDDPLVGQHISIYLFGLICPYIDVLGPSSPRRFGSGSV